MLKHRLHHSSVLRRRIWSSRLPAHSVERRPSTREDLSCCPKSSVEPEQCPQPRLDLRRKRTSSGDAAGRADRRRGCVQIRPSGDDPGTGASYGAVREPWIGAQSSLNTSSRASGTVKVRRAEVISLGRISTHGPLGRQALGDLLAGAGVQSVIDVRRFPGSRRKPDVFKDAMPGWLNDLGIGYRWEDELGGRRRLPFGSDSTDPWWTVAAFRACRAHPHTAVRGAGHCAGGVARVRGGDVQRERLVAMPPAPDPRRDDAVHQANVQHLMHGGRLRRTRRAERARVRRDGCEVWDADS